MEKPKPIQGPPAIKAACVVCGQEKSIQYSLRLKRDNGRWETAPVCQVCRAGLIREAKVEGIFVAFFSLESSIKEAEKRNKGLTTFKSFLDKYGRDRKTLEAIKAKAIPADAM